MGERSETDEEVAKKQAEHVLYCETERDNAMALYAALRRAVP